MKIIGARFKEQGKVHYFDPKENQIKKNDVVVVSTDIGPDVAYVVVEPQDLPSDMQEEMIPAILRVATEKDYKTIRLNKEREAKALVTCQERVEAHKLEMNLVNAEFAFSGSRVTFYFTANGRIDFRELVRDLASIFKIRIEMRQVGVRDKARVVGGIGICGREVCCKSFLDEFYPVSIRMAKDQDLSLNPTKISGICGRLLCCLQYEQGCYEETRKTMPDVGSTIKTPEGIGIVLSNHVIKESVKVKLQGDDGYEIKEYPLDAIEALPRKKENIKETMDLPEKS